MTYRKNGGFPTRREVLSRSMGGLGSVLLSWMLHENPLRASDGRTTFDLLPREPHFEPKAKSVIFLFMAGGPSQVDLFDPKPLLNASDGKTPPMEVVSRRKVDRPQLMASPFKFQAYGESGIEVSELLPGLASVVDDIAVIRSGVTERVDHDTAQYHYITGRNVSGFPSIGSWATYGLGSENSNMPGYVALRDNDSLIGARAWTSGWLPPTYAGTVVELDRVPIPDLQRPPSLSEPDERSVIEMVSGLNRLNRERHPHLLELDTRIANYELAARMQIEAMKLVDFSNESEETKRLYGMDNEITARHGSRCLLARRLVESGVRFVQITKDGWDHHSDIAPGLKKMTSESDIPVAGLIKDLKQRGLLDSTLIVWGGEFGRLPTTERGTGRDHNPKGFSVWMAGGGIKGGTIYGGDR